MTKWKKENEKQTLNSPLLPPAGIALAHEHLLQDLLLKPTLSHSKSAAIVTVTSQIDLCHTISVGTPTSTTGPKGTFLLIVYYYFTVYYVFILFFLRYHSFLFHMLVVFCFFKKLTKCFVFVFSITKIIVFLFFILY